MNKKVFYDDANKTKNYSDITLPAYMVGLAVPEDLFNYWVMKFNPTLIIIQFREVDINKFECVGVSPPELMSKEDVQKEVEKAHDKLIDFLTQDEEDEEDEDFEDDL